MSADTRGFASTPDLQDLQDRWEKTQLGQLVKDEAMQPFVEDMKRQLERKLSGVEQKLGLTYEDLRDVAAGEISLAMIERKNQPAAVAVAIDVTGRSDAARALLAKIDADLAKRRAKRSEANSGGVALTVYNIPPQNAKDIPRVAVFFQHQDMLCASDDLAEAQAMIDRFGATSGRLADVKAFQEAMSRCAAEAGSLRPDVRWFVDPWGYARATRSLIRDEEPHRGKDYVSILEGQGFDAIQGMGGFVNLAVDGRYEILHRSAVYAPPVPGAEDKYRLAMRMMEFPNSESLAPQKWIPRKLASYRTFNCDLKNAYEHFGTLFDAIAGVEDAFAEAIKGLEVDPYGPQIKVEPDFIAHLGSRVSLVTDYELPITTKSERYMFVVELTDEKAVAATIEKLMLADPNAHRREFEGKTVWEILPPTDDLAQFELGLEPIGGAEQSPSDSGAGIGGKAISNSAVCVTDGHLFLASHLTFLQRTLAKDGPQETLGNAVDFNEVQEAMNQIIGGPVAVRCFRRSDEAYRPTYELLRQGKMPESETLLGRVLNRLLTPPEDEEEGILRKQKIDGRQLPNFEMVRRYFSPAGTVVRSLDDGWFVAGATLTKHPAQATADAAPVREASRVR